MIKWLEIELGNWEWILCWFLGHDMSEPINVNCGELWGSEICSCKRVGCRKVQ
jgi:hypothetical protein